MKKFFAILIFIAAHFYLNAQGPDFLWARQINGSLQGNQFIAVDAAGNVYTTGQFSNSVDFDPGPGVYTMYAGTTSNLFLTKFNAAGNFVWARQVEGSLLVNPNGLRVDGSGNIIIDGYFSGTADFDPGPNSFPLICSGYEDPFVMKLDVSGNLIWAKKMSSTNSAVAKALAVDASGNIYVAGNFTYSCDFDPGPALYTQNTYGTEDAFICKLSPVGNFIWMKHIGGIVNDHALCTSIETDASANIYFTGSFYGTAVDFDPGAGSYILNSSFNIEKSYFAKLDASGNFIWAKQLIGVYDPSLTSFGATGKSIALDPSGNILLAGQFAGKVDFDCNGGTFYLISTDGHGYISKYDNSGNFLWARKSGEYSGGVTTTAWTSAVASDAAGNVYYTGFFMGSVDFNTGPGDSVLTSIAIQDTYITKLTPSGSFSWVKQLGGQGTSGAFCIVVDASGNIYTGGAFIGSVDFNPGPGIYLLDASPAYSGDIFVQKMGACNQSTSADMYVMACDSFVLNQHQYDSSGTYTQTLQNNSGCDSTLILHLTIGRKSTNMSAVVCHALDWNGKTYTSSGVYADTLTSFQGCDSVVTLQLTIMPNTVFTTSVNLCAGQTYAGYSVAGTYIDTFVSNAHCDSIRILHLGFQPWTSTSEAVTICKGEVYSGYSTSGTYHDSLPGCKIETTILTVKDGCFPVHIPSAFTPNHDGLNDVFQPVIHGSVKEYQFTIFNRWGQKVFETKKYGMGWDGSFQGKPQPPGTYVYRISFKDASGELIEKSGTITLIK